MSGGGSAMTKGVTCTLELIQYTGILVRLSWDIKSNQMYFIV